MAGFSELGPYIVAAIAAVPGYLAYRASSKAQEHALMMGNNKVSQDAFNQAKDFYESTLLNMKTELRETQSALAAALARENTKDTAIRLLEMRVGELQADVSRLRLRMAQEGIHLPEEPLGN